MSLAKFLSHIFITRWECFLVGAGGVILGLVWGTQPTPVKECSMIGLRTAWLGFSTLIMGDSTSMWAVNHCFSFVVINFEAALVLRRLQAIILNITKAVFSSEVHLWSTKMALTENK
jgi:hypothetical protein